MENKLTIYEINKFEEDQACYGTEVALYNIYWELAADIMKSIGVTRITTKEPKEGALCGRS